MDAPPLIDALPLCFHNTLPDFASNAYAQPGRLDPRVVPKTTPLATLTGPIGNEPSGVATDQRTTPEVAFMATQPPEVVTTEVGTRVKFKLALLMMLV